MLLHEGAKKMREPRVLTEGQDAIVEKRESQRAPVVIRVEYSTPDAFFSDFTADINEGGLFIETEQPHPDGTPVSLYFALPDSDELVKVTGHVVWSRGVASGEPPGMGIEFEDLASEAKAHINNLVRQLRTEPR